MINEKGHCYDIKEKLLENVSRYNFKLVSFSIFFDFLLQNTMIALFAVSLCYQEFITKSVVNVYIGLITFYACGTFIPHIFAILGSSSQTYHGGAWRKIHLAWLSLAQLHMIFMIFWPHYMKPNAKSLGTS